ncbi:uncharacterized protein LOC100185389 [Ciona intestinalis]
MMSNRFISPCITFVAMCLLATLIITPLTVYVNTNVKDTDGMLQRVVRNIKQDESLHSIERRSVNNTGKNPHQIACGKPKSCDKCVSITNYHCMWCTKGNKCSPYPFKHILPRSTDCDWENARWGVCWIDFRALLISVSVIGGILTIIICCCIVKFCKCVTDCCHVVKFCCCCECFSDSRSSRKEEKSLKRLERKLQIQARRQEMMLRYGSQRPGGVPYGSTGNYSQFDNTPI